MTIAQKICKAIKSQNVLTFYYPKSNGIAALRRVEPHLLGHEEDGDLALSAWQLGIEKGEGWRRFHLSKLTELTITDRTFTNARPGYNPNDKTIPRVLCKLLETQQ